MMDNWDGIIIGAAAAAIVTVLATRYLEHTSFGGGTPVTPVWPAYQSRGGYLAPQNVCPLPMEAAPLAQNTPITEAAYNQGMTGYEPAFNTNLPEDEHHEAFLEM